MSFWRDWQAERALRTRAEQYARFAWREPAEEDVAWLAATATDGDEDHARWELRYLRRALALLVAERDALDDRTASVVAQVLFDLLQRDRGVAADRIRIAERQFNARLSRYRDVFRERVPRPMPDRVAGAMFGFAAHQNTRLDEAAWKRGAAVVEATIAEVGEALREVFGVASLPEDVRPSALVEERGGKGGAGGERLG